MLEVAEHPTLVDRTPNGGATHNEGWLTAEAYLAWIAGTSEVSFHAGDSPFSQPPPFVLTEEVEEFMNPSDNIAA